MKKRQKMMSEYEYHQVDKFIRHLYFIYGKGLDYEECRGIAFLEYAEVRDEICEIYNREILWDYAERRIVAAFKEVRKLRNQKCHLEAVFSLNQTLGASSEPVYAYFFPAKGNFVNALCFWYDMKALGERRYRMLLGLYMGSEDWEVMRSLKLSADEYFELKKDLRMAVKEYLGGNRGGKANGKFSAREIL